MLPLDPCIGTNGRVSDEVVDHLHPRLMAGQVVIVLRCHLPHLWQSAPRDIREVVVLIVITHIEGDIIERPIITVRLETFVEHVVLRDEVSSHWMESHSQQGSPSQIEYPLSSKVIKHQEVAGELDNVVDDFQECGSLGVGDDRSQSIKQWLQTHPDQLPKSGAEQSCLQAGRDVSVQLLISLEFVMLQVVPFE